MKKLRTISLVLFTSFMTSSAFAGYGDLPGLELRNASAHPVTVKVSKKSPVDPENSEPPVEFTVPPMTTDKSSVIHVDQFKEANIRYGTVTVEVAGEKKFEGVVDLASAFSYSSNNKATHSFRGWDSQDSSELPDWLYASVKVTPFDLATYTASLIQQWTGLSEDQKKDHYTYLPDFPSCFHVLDTKPKVETPYSYCLRSPRQALLRYAAERGVAVEDIENPKIPDDQVHLAEKIVHLLGLPIFYHE